MSKVPDRFLGFAFTVGDLLLEINTNYDIMNADGAISILVSKKSTILVGRNLREFLSESDEAILGVSLRGLKGRSRIGPILLKLKNDKGKEVEYALFAGQLPLDPDRIYLAISNPYRLGLDGADDHKTDEEKKEEFFDRLDNLLSSEAEGQDNLMVTVMEAVDNAELSEAKQQEMEGFLKNFSLGGSHAAKLAENKFAVVHEKEEIGQEGTMAKEISLATGVDLSSATIDTATANSANQDGVKALVFSLQRFAEGSAGFDAASFAEKGGDLLGETTQKVRVFRGILNQGQFSLVYQPIVALRSGYTHHFEALSRFNVEGLQGSQFEMICFAEEVGLIIDFDQAVLKRTIDKLKPQIGMASAPNVAVNISGKSLSTPAFVEQLVKDLKAAPSLATNLSLEVTESSKIHDLVTINKVLQEIREIGFKIYLDDFGAGAAGFEYLRELEVDGVKIDGAYIRDALTNPKTRAFLRSMVTLCQDLNINTVGEWVETKEHADLLTKLGVTYGQGYYFGKPTKSMVATRARPS